MNSSLQTQIPAKQRPYEKFFFDLPAELRNPIYDLVLIRPRKLNIVNNGIRGKVILNSTRVLPTILRTCRRVYEEATPILYSEHQFSCGSHPCTAKFLRMIGPSVKFLKHIELNGGASVRLDLPKDLQLLKDADALEKLVLHDVRIEGIRLRSIKGLRILHEKRKADKDKMQVVDILEIRRQDGILDENMMATLRRLFAVPDHALALIEEEERIPRPRDRINRDENDVPEQRCVVA